MKTWTKAAAAIALTCTMPLALAETLSEAKALLDAATATLKSKGMEAATQEFNAGGKWKTDKAYVVVVGFQGDMFAHSSNPKLAGKNMLEVKDASGRPFIQEIIKTVQGGSEAQLQLRWANPNTKKIDDGHMVARRVPGQDAYVGVPYFD